ncbi:hypothetical protein [Streptomyces amakusaensis]|uniref:Uncharacterized protein n=1 Tax=Streptomyces amakusaensis TaxID=67271 RepID=A0ABW0AH89_9ACTN
MNDGHDRSTGIVQGKEKCKPGGLFGLNATVPAIGISWAYLLVSFSNK